MDKNEKLEALKKFYSEMEGKNHFEILGLSHETNDEAVRTAYLGLMKLYGADYFHHVVDSESRKAVEEVNRRLRQAYDAIGKASKRDSYIATLNGKPDEVGSDVDIVSVFEAEQATSQARSLMERGEFNVAIQKLEKAQRLDPKSIEIKVRLRYAQYMIMNVDDNGHRSRYAVKDVREFLEESCESLPNADYLRVYLGELENLEGNLEKSDSWYKAALKINPDNVQAKRAVMLSEERVKKEKKKQEDETPKSFMDKVKAVLKKLDNIKLG